MSNIFPEEFGKNFQKAREKIRTRLKRNPEFNRGPLAVPPGSPLTFAAWLEKEGLPVFYSDLFSMPRSDLVRLYNITFDRIELLETYIEGNKSMFERLRLLRLNYVDVHNFHRWSALRKDEDYHHLEWKDDVFGQIEAIVTKLQAQQKQVSLLERQLKLVVCVLLRVHTDYESLRRASSTQAFRGWHRRFPRIAEILDEELEEKRLHSMNDPKWDKHPRIDWAVEGEEE
jgi:hypothetical protein